MNRPRLLDLFCGEGGAGYGYQLAGWDITGVDLARRCQGRYPGRFVRGDAIAFARAHAGEFDAVHASPPCKVHTVARRLTLELTDADAMLFPMPTHTDLIPDTRAALVAAGVPYVIENVPGAPLNQPVMLCGTMFGLGAACRDEWRQLRRHRLFEWEWAGPGLVAPAACDHGRGSLSVFGNGGGGKRPNRTYLADLGESRDALGTPWMTKQGCSQAIPPAYTEWIGAQLRATVRAA